MINNIAAILVTYNCDDQVIEGIKSVREQVMEIVIVDNGSSPTTLGILDKLDKENNNIKLIKNKTNKGIANALNKGVKYCVEKGYKWIITLDHDSVCTENMISTMFNAYDTLSSDDKESVVSILPVFLEKNFSKELVDITNGQPTFNYIISGITSGNILKTSIFNKIGFFNEDLFIDYVDHDFCLRIKEAGYKIIQANEAKLLHELGDTAKKSVFGKEIFFTNHSSLRRYYITRNRHYFWKKYKNIDRELIRNDKIGNFKEMLKILLWEENKIEKFKMIFIGTKDYYCNRYGEYGRVNKG